MITFRNPMPPITIPRDDKETERAVKALIKYATENNMSWQAVIRAAIQRFAYQTGKVNEEKQS